MAAGIAAVLVVAVISAGAGQIGIVTEVSGTGGSAREMPGCQFIADPERDPSVLAVADDEKGTVCELLAGIGAGGRAEAVMLGG